MKKGIVLALAVIVSLVLPGVSFAEGGPGATPQKLESLNYPSKGIELVIPYAAGGAMDSTGRIFAKYAEKYTGQSISINNVSGGSGFEGAKYLMTTNTDGYTLFLSDPGPGFVRTGANQVPFDFEVAMVPAARINVDSRLIAVSTEHSPFKTPQEFVDYAKAHPGELKIGTPGEYTDGGMAVELLKRAGLDLNAVACNGSGAVREQVLSGALDGGALTVSDVYKLLPDGKLMIVGILSEEKVEAIPDAPTFRELGYDAVWSTSRGISLRAGTDVRILWYWAGLAEQIAKDPEYQKELAELGLKPSYMAAEEYSQEVHGIFKTIQDILK